MTKDEALRMAIEALEDALTKFSTFNEMQHDAIQACKDALAQPAECKHDWVSAKNKFVQNGSICLKCFAIDAKESDVLNAEAGLKEGKAETQEPVLVNATTHDGQTYKIEVSAPSREWVGLSDAELEFVSWYCGQDIKRLALAIEAKLKEKNNG